MLSEEKKDEIYGKRKIDVEPVLGFLRANLHVTRMCKEQVKNEKEFALMAVNLRKYNARQAHQPIVD